jgi:hypothetical protein
MPGITGQGQTFNLPNYTGRLFSVSPTETPFLSMIGGLSGGEEANAVEYEWQTFDLRAPAARPRLEGADAPAPEHRTRVNVSNVVQIVHEAVDVSYTKSATAGQLSGINVEGGSNPVASELPWQITQALKQVATDTELSFLTGTYAKPGTNAQARRTRGILQAITTNVSSNGGTARDLTEIIVLDLLQDAWESGGIREDETRTLMVNASLKRALTKVFIKDKGYEESSRVVGGVHVQTIETDFGKVNIALNRHMPTDTLLVVSAEVCKPRILFIPGKGFLFAEPLAKTGASDRVQLYGEIGLEYGHEAMHAKAVDLKAPAGA